MSNPTPKITDATLRLINECQAASYLGVKPRKMWSLGVAGEHGAPDGIPRVRIGKRVLYDVADLDAFIQRAKRVAK